MFKASKACLATAISLTVLPLATMAGDYRSPSIPSIVVTVENSAPSRGALQTPFWVGIHNGSFDIYDRNVALGEDGLVPSPAVERLAEDGNTGPISTEFSISQPYSPQSTIVGPSGPFTPGDRSSTTLNVDPSKDRFFSYASMVIPSNDAFIANGGATAHPMFDEYGRFVAKDFVVTGGEVLDAGTEVNNETASETAFLNQGGPDIGTIENGVVTIHPGLLAAGSVTYPDGVLNHPVFGLADFLAPTYRAANFKFRFVDLGRTNVFRTALSPEQEVSSALVDSDASGRAVLVSRDGDRIRLRIRFEGLTGPLQMAHLHLGQEGTNGPVVVNLDNGISGNRVRATIKASDVVGPLADGDDPMLNLLNELAAGNIYVNLHTEANPAGELRGQVSLRKTRDEDDDDDD